MARKRKQARILSKRILSRLQRANQRLIRQHASDGHEYIGGLFVGRVRTVSLDNAAPDLGSSALPSLLFLECGAPRMAQKKSSASKKPTAMKPAAKTPTRKPSPKKKGAKRTK